MTESHASYFLLKANGLCPHCKGEPKPGKVYCAEYTRRQYALNRDKPARRAYMKLYLASYQRRRRARLRKQRKGRL